MTARTPPRFLRMLSILVRRADRAEWVEEWHGELLQWWERSRETGVSTFATRLRVWRLMFGALPDALSIAFHRMRTGILPGGGLIELRLAVRSLRKRPGFSFVAVITLALGIGANSALFSVVHAVLIEPFPYPDASRIVRFLGHPLDEPPGRGTLAYPNAYDIRAEATRFEHVALYDEWEAALVGGGEAGVLSGAQVSWNFFDLLGIPPAVGRYFREDEEGPGREPAVVLSHRLWTERFAQDPNITERTIELNGTTFAILGVVGAEFEDPRLSSDWMGSPDVWKTVNFERDAMPRGGRAWTAIGRVSPDHSVEAAAEEVRLLMSRLRDEYPVQNAERTISALPLQDLVVGSARAGIGILLGAVVLVLLIACANLASLLVARGLDRHQETAIQRALGASRGRVVGRVLLESLMLSVVGGAIGVFLAWAGTQRIVALAGDAIPRADTISVDLPVLLFSVALSLGAGLVFGGLPAWVLSRESAFGASGLRGRPGDRGGPRGARLRQMLILGEVVLSTVLLLCSGLLLKSFWKLGNVELGVNTESVTVAGIHGSPFWDLTVTEGEARYQELFRAITTTTDVAALGAIDLIPMGGSFSCDGVRRTDLPPPEPGQGECGEVRTISGDLFGALEIDLLAGRYLETEEVDDATPETVISVALAELLWPGEDPVGATLHVHAEEYTVVGIVEEVANFGPERGGAPQVYIPAVQDDWNGFARGLHIVARSATERPIPPAELETAIRGVDPDLPLRSPTTMEALAGESVSGARFRTSLLAGFSILALLLAAIGIVGIIGYSVRTRTREMGVRLVHGATSHDIRSMVLTDGVRLLAPGIAVGVVVALLAARALSSVLFQVSSWDPWVAALSVGTIGLAVILGCVLPARRAATIEPSVALRAE